MFLFIEEKREKIHIARLVYSGEMGNLSMKVISKDKVIEGCMWG